MTWAAELEMFADLRNVVRDRDTWSAALPTLRAHRRRIAMVAGLAVIGVALSLLQPLLYREALNAAVAASLGRQRAALNLPTVALLVLAAGLAQAAAGFAEQRRRGDLAEHVASRLREDLFDHLQTGPLAFFVHANPGAVYQRLWDEPLRAGGSVASCVSEGFRAVLTLAAAPAIVAFYDVRLAAAMLTLLILFVPSSFIRRRVRAAIVEQAIIHAKYAGLLMDRISVGGALLTRVFGLERANKEALHRHAERYRVLGRSTSTWQAVNQAIIGSGLALAVFGVVWFGGNEVAGRSLSIGDLALLLFYLRVVAVPIQNYSQIRMELIRGFVAYARIFEVLALPPEQTYSLNGVVTTPVPGEVLLDDVSFAYPSPADVVPQSLSYADLPGERGTSVVLHDISLRIEPGAFVALVGASGSGKSTIASLVAGIHFPTRGRVLVGGADLQTFDRSALQGSVGLVTQDTHLIHDTIRNNLLLARPDASDKQLVRACVAAGIHSFIRSLPNGYATVVGERGVRLSGGQRQRIAFARVLLMDPAVVVLDEATAHLDTESETLLREAVDKVLAGRTRVVIAHRLSTIIDADEIVVVHEGRVVERGSHTQLIEAQGTYSRLYSAQMPQQDRGLTAGPTLAATMSNPMLDARRRADVR